MKSVLIVGATGLVGGAALAQALADPRWTRVVAPTRRPLAETMESGAGAKAGAVAREGRLLNPVVDFAALQTDADWWAVDAVVCALGTTIKHAGSQEAFRRVDHDLPLTVARHARQAGAGAYVLVSSQGANAASRIFYLRVKGETEAALAACDYPSLTLLRPSLLGGQRAESRPGERLAQGAMRWLAPVIPRRYRMVAATDVAHAALAAAWTASPGRRVVESEAIPRWAVLRD